jgi:hypothetical protein
MSKLSKREKWAKETGLSKEQYKNRKSIPMPVKNKGLAINQSERPKGVSKREYWASKSGYTKEQYKDRASLPAIKPQPKRYSIGGGGSSTSKISSSLPRVGILANYAKAFSQRIEQGTQQFQEGLKPVVRKMAGEEPYTPKELIHMRREWKRSGQPVEEKLQQVRNITQEIRRVRQVKQVKQQEIAQKTQEQIDRESADPHVQFGRFITNVQQDPIGTIRKVWTGEYDKERAQTPIYTPPKLEDNQYAAPRVDLRKSILGKYLGGAANALVNAPLQTGTELYNRAVEAKRAKDSGSRLDFAIAEGRLGISEINTIFTPISMLFSAAKELGVPEEVKMANPIHAFVQNKITKLNLDPEHEKALRYVAGVIVNPLDPKSFAEMAEAPIQLSGKAGAYVADKALDALPISPINKTKLRPLFNEAGALIAQIGLFELGMKGAKKAIGTGEVATPEVPIIPREVKSTMADITKEGRAREVLLHPELREQSKRPKIEDIKRVPVEEAPKAEKLVGIDEIIKESPYVKAVEKPKVTTVTGREAAGKARFDFKTKTGEVVLTPGQTEVSKAHEFGHVMNFVLGEGEKLSNRINEALQGKFERTEAITKFGRENKLELPTAEITKLMKSQISEVAKIDKPKEYKFSNASEEFAHAVANAIVSEKRSAAVAPEWTKFIRKEAIPEKIYKTESPAQPTKAEIEFAKEPKALPKPRATVKQRERAVTTKPIEEKVVVLPESETQKAGRTTLMEKAKEVKTGLKKEAKGMIETAKEAEAVYKKSVEAQMKAEVRIERREGLIDNGLKKAIQTSEYFRKERSARDAWRDGVVYVKNGDYRIAMTDTQKANLKMRGYQRYAGVDEIAKEKGYEDTHKYIEEVVDELNDKWETLTDEDKIAHDYLMKESSEYRQVIDTISRLEDKINELKQPYEATTTVAIEKKTAKPSRESEANAKRVAEEKPVEGESARDYLQRKSGQIRFRERTVRGNELSRKVRELRAQLKGQEDNGAGFFAKRSTIKAIRAAENEMFRMRREGARYRLKDDFESATGIKISDKQEAQIRQLNNRIFGDEDVKITSQILTPEGQKALGAYKDGMIKILDGQADPKGTFYHEAVHKYLERFMTLDEQANLLDAARKEFKTKDYLEAEEKLAEAFINYAKNKEGVTGTIKAHFDRIIQRIKRFFGSEDQIKSFYNEVILGKRAREGVLAEAVKKVRQPFAKPKWEGGKSPLTYREPKTTPIRLDKLNTSEAVKDAIAKITIADNKRIGIQRRGRMTMQEIKELADLTSMNPKDVMNAKAGSIVNAENAFAVRKLMVTVASELSDYAKSLPKELTESQRTEFKAKLNAFRKIQNTLAGIRTETGRALRQFREEVMPEEYDVLDELITEVKKIDAIEADTIQKATKVAKLVKPEGLYKMAVRALVAARTAWMLYKPTTHIANIGGGIWKALTIPVTRKFAEKISPYVKGQGEGIARGEAGYFLGGMADAAPEAWKTFRTELREIGLLKIPEHEAVKSTEIPRTRDIKVFLERIKVPGKVADKVDAATTMSFQFLTAADKFFKTIIGAGELYSQALRKASNEGLTGKQFQNRLVDLISDPSRDAEFLKSVNKETQIALFQERTGLNEKINALMRKYPEAKIISPFVMTPSNIALDAIRTSPAGFLRPLYKKGRFGEEMTNAEKSLAYGQATLGAALAAATMVLVAKNRLTLVPPRGNEKEEFYAGKQAYSIKIGNKYIQFRRIDPLASIMVNAANAYNILAKGEASYGAKAISLVTMFARNIMDQTFMSGVSDMFEALSDINVDENGNTTFGKAAQRFLNQLGVSIVPYQSFLAGVTAVTDRTLREKEEFGDVVKSILPGYSKTLPATIDIFGNAVTDERGWLGRAVSPFKTKGITSDKTLQELQKSGYNLSTIKLEQVGNYNLNGKAKEYWFRIIGKETKRRLDTLIETEEYKNLDQQGRDDLIGKAIGKLRSEYRDKLKKELAGSSQENQIGGLKRAFPSEMRQIESGQDPISQQEIPEVKPTIHKDTAQGEEIKWREEHPDKNRRAFKDQYEAIDHWKPYIDAAADDAKVPRYLMYALMSQESGGDPKAQNPKSSAGGLFQFIDSTWKYVTKKYGGEELPIEKKYDPETNAHYAALYLKELVDQKHTYRKALAAYGEGEAYADKILARQKEIEGYYREKRKQTPSDVIPEVYQNWGWNDTPDVNELLQDKRMEEFFKPFLFGDIPNTKVYEGEIDKKLREFLAMKYPLTPEAKKDMENNIAFNTTDIRREGIWGQYFEAWKENKHLGQSLAPGKANRGLVMIFGNPDAEVAMHESLHSLLMEKGMDRNQGWVDEFNSAWDKALKRKDTDVKNAEDRIQAAAVYQDNDINSQKDWLANERFAHLGDIAGRDGLNNFPKELRQYYRGIFEPTLTKSQVRKFNRIADQINEGKIDEDTAAEKLRKFMPKNRHRMFSFARYISELKKRGTLQK